MPRCGWWSGKINLVEKIAELARITPQQVEKLDEEVRRKFKAEALRKAMADAPRRSCRRPAASTPAKPKEIIKEGLERVLHLHHRRHRDDPQRLVEADAELRRARRCPSRSSTATGRAEYGDQLVRMYLLTNDKDSKLGTTPLPDGMVRVFRQNGRDGLSFLVAQQIKYIPIGDKIELNLGPDPEVIFELVKLRTWRDNIWMQIQGADVFKRVDEPGVQIEVNSTVVGWDDHTLYAQRIRNYTKKPIDVEIRRTLPGHIVFRSALGAKNFDYQTVEYHATVKPMEKADLLYEVLQHQGRNAKQNNVTVEAAPVK